MHASYGPSCQDSGKIQTGSTDIQEYASYTRQGDRPGTGHRHSDTALRSERAAEKKRRGPINSPSGTAPERFRFRNNRRSVRNIPPRAIAMQDSRMFGRMPLQAFPSGQPDLQPFRNKTRNGPSTAGIMPDAVTKRRRGSGRTGRGNEPPSKNTTNTNKKRSPASLQGSLRRRLPTLPHVTAVPSA